MEIATAEIMRRLDRRTIDEVGIPGIVLMENAGRGTFRELLDHYPGVEKQSIAVVAGKGNNGGDGFVVGRYLANAGTKVDVFILCAREEIKGDALVNLNALEYLQPRFFYVTSPAEWKEVRGEIRGVGLIVDAIFGTGLSAEVQGLAKEVIEDLNLSEKPIVSVDLPSGLDSDRGIPMGSTIKADMTVTFGLPKRGLVVYPGICYRGDLKVIDIGIPRRVVEEEHIKDHLLSARELGGSLLSRDAEAHKGSFGHVVVVSGSPGKTGASVLTCEAAMRIGAGLVTLGIGESLNPVLESKLTEAMTLPLPEGKRGFLGRTSWAPLKEFLKGKEALVIGPGLSVNDETAALVRQAIVEAGCPVVVDADGLNAVASDPEILNRSAKPLIVTPHPGEMARLLATSTGEVQRNRYETARKFAERYGVYVVLKGARTVIAEPSGVVAINPTGNAGMASGGMGDVLTGMIGGLLAQGYEPSFAARLATFLHGYIGDVVSKEKGMVGIIASDVVERIPGALRSIRDMYCEERPVEIW